ncbi:hypothetical protein PghCCS26_04420 [Paenibacillus glycanilyticus]|uniref:Class I SAM-dependent methyltransferase n=1 Tax=Paenibacillus glycanilyticus TaxID=126569 RepID=A0ABQ6NFG3_9BACL|nr:class I SAM-dependent methyltransferase [Paenibacillus glycanilyticus]GMK43315.1 hypothetical protein PghCCS26_04420 [Paenibacillus glycanilyticus]
MNWNFYRPTFAADSAPEIPTAVLVGGAWSGHRRFAYDIVRYAKPKTIVELGTFYGTSFFSFCQAVQDARIQTKCYAVDTWQGDVHTGPYGHLNIFQNVHSFNSRQFSAFSTLLRTTFDEALALFQDNSIDLLHIDGCHTYEAALHDFTSWLPKLSPNGIILFHDIVVKLPTFGVHVLWEQLSAVYPHFQFAHSNGLGVLFPKGCTESFKEVIDNQNLLVRHYSR